MSKIGYLDQIKQLVELQKVDDDIFEVRCSIENTPRDLEELKRRFNEAAKKRDFILDKLSHLNEQKKRLSFEIEDDSARIKKSKNKMMSVGNTREYQAMIREMDNMEKSTRTREEERTTLLEEIQKQEESKEEIEKVYTSLNEEMTEKEAALEQTLQEGQDRLKVLDHQRLQVGEGIPKQIFRRYEFIRNRLEHPVIVPVRDAICTGCNIAIPPQDYIKLQLGQEILSCPNCQRLIYWNEHFSLPEDRETPVNADNEDAAADIEAKKAQQQEIWPEDTLKSDDAVIKGDFELPEHDG